VIHACSPIINFMGWLFVLILVLIGVMVFAAKRGWISE
jgi:hypothetical protein